MAVRFQCPNPECGKRYKVDDSLLGRTTRCRYCGREFTISGTSWETLHPDADEDTAQPGARPPVAPADVPRSLGRFEIRGRLGSGSFGTVYRAHDPLLDRDVALKVPRAAVLENAKARARFLREPKAAAQLRHPHIVPVYDAGSADDHYYIASAFIEGHTLETAIQEKRPDFRRSAAVVRSLAEALDYAHRVGVVHRDVKPPNVMLDTRGQPMLMDFGLAHLATSEEKLTQDGAVMGTPAYMAPEQVDGSMGEVGPASDQYALGVVLYELLTGETPFSGPPSVLLFNTVTQEPDPPRKKDATIPRDLETICLKALSKKPDERYGDCGGMAEDLRRWLSDEPILARPLGPVERALRWGRRNPVVASLVALVFATTFAGLAAVTWQWGRAEVNRQRAEANLGDANTQRALAEENARQAEANAEDADSQRRTAQENLDEATRQEALAQANAEAAKKAQAQAEFERDRTEVGLYVARIRLAYQKWLAHEIDGAEESLDLCHQSKRHWEWRYLKRLCHSEALVLPAHSSAAFSANGTRVAAASGENTVKVWEIPSGREVLTFRGHDKKVVGVAFSPDGKRIASGGVGRKVKVWDAATGQEIVTFDPTTATSDIDSVAFSPDGTQLLAESFNGGVHDANTGRELYDVHSGHEAHQMVFLPDGQRVAVANGGGDVKLLGPADVPRTRFEASVRYLTGVAVSADGKRIAAAGTDAEGEGSTGEIHVWDLATGEDLLVARGRRPTCVAFSPDGSYLAASGWDGLVRILDSVTADQVTAFAGHENPVHSVTFSGDGRWLASTDTGGELRLWPATTTPQVRRLGLHEAPVHTVTYSPDGQRIASGDQNGAIKIADSTTGNVLLELEGHMGMITDLAFSPDGRRVLSASVDKTWTLWDAASGGRLFSSQPRAAEVTCVAVSPDGQRIASGGYGGTVCVSGMAGEDPVEYGGHVGAVMDLAFSPDGRLIASVGGQGKTVRLWDAVSQEEIHIFKGHTDWVESVAFSPDGSRIASGSRDMTIILWDAAGTREPLSLRGHTGTVTDLAFSSDGKRLASAGRDGTLRIWDVETAQEMLVLRGHTEAVTGVAFHPSGNWIASSSLDGSVGLWEGTPPAEVAGPAVPTATVPLRRDEKAELDPESLLKRISRVEWAGEEVELRYLGRQAVEENTLGPIREYVDGLAFHPDGRIAFSAGGGSTRRMQIRFWRKGGAVVPLKFGSSSRDDSLPEEESRRRYEEQRAAMERRGEFWFFSGPMAFDAAGTCYFNLGNCGGNGVYKVKSANPVDIERLRACGSGVSMQIPSFDTSHIYLTGLFGVSRYPIGAIGTAKRERWFSLEGAGGSLYTLIASPTELLVTVLLYVKRSEGDSAAPRRVMRFDREAGTFTLLPEGFTGPFAISWDGTRMIRFDASSKSIKEFTLK